MSSGTALPPLVFRWAEPADVDAIVRLVESAYRGEASRRGWTTEADILDGQRTDADSILELVRAPDNCLLLAQCGAALVSSCHLRREGGTAYFGMFAVAPELQSGGIGRAVLAEAERRAQAEFGATEMRMTVIDCRAELIAWYERRGYSRTGEHSPFPYGDEKFGLPRRADLRFETLRKLLPGVAG